jgi:peroxiredoxin
VQLNRILTEFSKRNVALVGISTDRTAVLARFAARRDIGFALLSDKDARIIKAFDLYNERALVARPAVYFVDPKGIIRGILKEGGYKARPRPQDVLATVDRQLK